MEYLQEQLDSLLAQLPSELEEAIRVAFGRQTEARAASNQVLCKLSYSQF